VLVAIPLFERFTALDAVGPYEVLQRVPSADVVFVGHQRGEVRSDNGMLGMMVDKTYAEITQPDVVVFPGGIGTRVLINDAEVLDWVRGAYQHSRFTTSVCTGGLVLAAAGLLDGLTATTHWRVQELFNSLGAVRGAAGGGARTPTDHHRGGGLQRHRHGAAVG
jgi:putative intracellular protease/amidase